MSITYFDKSQFDQSDFMLNNSNEILPPSQWISVELHNIQENYGKRCMPIYVQQTTEKNAKMMTKRFTR